MNEYLNMWRNYVNFSDRTDVRGYWMAFLFNVLAGAVLSIIGRVLYAATGIPVAQTALTSLYSLAALLPGLGLTVRRLNDSGKKWSWIFISLIPLVGSIWLIVLLCQKSVAPDGRPMV